MIETKIISFNTAKDGKYNNTTLHSIWKSYLNMVLDLPKVISVNNKVYIYIDEIVSEEYILDRAKVSGKERDYIYMYEKDDELKIALIYSTEVKDA